MREISCRVTGEEVAVLTKYCPYPYETEEGQDEPITNCKWLHPGTGMPQQCGYFAGVRRGYTKCKFY